MFGDGITKTRPRSGQCARRSQPSMGTTVRSHRRPAFSWWRSFIQRAISPKVRPWRVGSGIEADEGAVRGVEGRALDALPADGVRAVEHHDRLPELGRRLHHVARGVDVGVDAGADVLQVDDDGVHVGQHLRPRLPGLAVQAVERHALPLRVRRLDHVVLVLPPEAVLGREQRGDAEPQLPLPGEEQVHRGPAALVHRGLVGDEADAAPPQERLVPRVVEDARDAELEGHAIMLSARR